MKISFVVCSAVVGALAFTAPVLAKTAKECRAEWTASKAANQAKGITEKAYVTQCRAEAGAEKPKAAETRKEKKEATKMAAPATAEKKKTTKECRAEWTANKAANEAKGITEKVYVAECKSGTAMAPAPMPAAAKSMEKPEKSKMAAPAAAEKKKTTKECRAEWTANKAANQAKGVTEKAYVEQCRSGATAMTPPTSTPTPTETKMTPPASEPMKPAKKAAHTEMTPGMGKPEGANQFADESQAKAHCRSGTVVWANLDSKIYHFAGHADYGHTKQGAYMCESDATAEGMRPAKNEKHP
jgi:hypothetical protein